MAKVDKEFNVKDWEWIAVHFPASERESMAKVAWIICCKCTPEKNSQHKIDPRIVIPLCAIELLDEINILQLKNCVLQLKKLETELSDCYYKRTERTELLKKLATELSNFYYKRTDNYLKINLLTERKKLSDCYYKRTDNYLINLLTERFEISEELKITQEHINEIKEDVDGIIQDFIDFVIDLANPTERWLSLFKTLNIHLQFSLFSSLIKYRRPTRYDWRNIFSDIKGVFLGAYFSALSISILSMLISSMVIKVADFFIELIGNMNLVVFYLILLAKSLLLSLGGILFLGDGLTVWAFSFILRWPPSIFVYTLVMIYLIKYDDPGLLCIFVIVSINVIVTLLVFCGKYSINMLLELLRLNGCMLLFYGVFFKFSFSWKTTLLIWAIMLIVSSILWIYAQNLERKVHNPLKEMKNILKHKKYFP